MLLFLYRSTNKSSSNKSNITYISTLESPKNASSDKDISDGNTIALQSKSKNRRRRRRGRKKKNNSNTTDADTDNNNNNNNTNNNTNNNSHNNNTKRSNQSNNNKNSNQKDNNSIKSKNNKIVNSGNDVVVDVDIVEEDENDDELDELEKKDDSLYNYNARHPARMLMEECGGFDNFFSKLNDCVSNSKNKIRIRDDKSNKDYHDSSLILYNYVAPTLPFWCEYSILCRGLVIDPKNKKIIATPFPKFFNYGEFRAQSKIRKRIVQTFEALSLSTGLKDDNEPKKKQKTKTKESKQNEEDEQDQLDDEKHDDRNNKNIIINGKVEINIHEKMDGSLGIMFYCEKYEKWRINTRGSFHSAHAQWATQFILNYVDMSKGFIKGDTYLFEILNSDKFRETIYYDFQGLVLLAAYNSDGYEYTFEHLKKISKMHQPHS